MERNSVSKFKDRDFDDFYEADNDYQRNKEKQKRRERTKQKNAQKEAVWREWNTWGDE